MRKEPFEKVSICGPIMTTTEDVGPHALELDVKRSLVHSVVLVLFAN